MELAERGKTAKVKEEAGRVQSGKKRRKGGGMGQSERSVQTASPASQTINLTSSALDAPRPPSSTPPHCTGSNQLEHNIKGAVAGGNLWQQQQQQR
jgi:hypothetical protein